MLPTDLTRLVRTAIQFKNILENLMSTIVFGALLTAFDLTPGAYTSKT